MPLTHACGESSLGHTTYMRSRVTPSPTSSPSTTISGQASSTAADFCACRCCCRLCNAANAATRSLTQPAAHLCGNARHRSAMASRKTLGARPQHEPTYWNTITAKISAVPQTPSTYQCFTRCRLGAAGVPDAFRAVARALEARSGPTTVVRANMAAMCVSVRAHCVSIASALWVPEAFSFFLLTTC